MQIFICSQFPRGHYLVVRVSLGGGIMQTTTRWGKNHEATKQAELEEVQGGR